MEYLLQWGSLSKGLAPPVGAGVLGVSIGFLGAQLMDRAISNILYDSILVVPNILCNGVEPCLFHGLGERRVGWLIFPCNSQAGGLT